MIGTDRRMSEHPCACDRGKDFRPGTKQWMHAEKGPKNMKRQNYLRVCVCEREREGEKFVDNQHVKRLKVGKYNTLSNNTASVYACMHGRAHNGFVIRKCAKYRPEINPFQQTYRSVRR